MVSHGLNLLVSAIMNTEKNIKSNSTDHKRNFLIDIIIYRRSLVSIIEMFLLLSWGIIAAYREFFFSIYNGQYINTFLIFTSPSTLTSLTFLTVSLFCYILTGRALFVTLFTEIAIRLGDTAELTSRRVGRRNEYVNRAEHNVDDETGAGMPKEHSIPSNKLETVEDNFAVYIARSQSAAQIAQRRPNALLFVGTLVAISGLIFFVLTLPGSRYGFIDVTPTEAPNLKTDFLSTSVQLLPRLLMLVFIQVLAGFFLRQYRSSVEEFRYYEQVLRHREAQYLSYALRKQLDDKKALLKFADDLLQHREFGRLGRGETTSAIEVQRSELNEFSSLYEKIATLITRTQVKAARSTKARASVSSPDKPRVDHDI